jgi:hypothetical protein
VTKRLCSHRKPNGETCGSPPLLDREFCLFHDPDHADVVAEGRRLGGSQRKKAATVSAAFDYEGTDTIERIERLVDIAIIETLTLPNSVNRNRTLAYLAQTAVKLLEVGKYAEQLASLKAALEPRLIEVKRR